MSLALPAVSHARTAAAAAPAPAEYLLTTPTPLRALANEAAPVVTIIPAGTVVLVVGVTGSWYQIRSTTGRPDGFIPRENARLLRARTLSDDGIDFLVARGTTLRAQPSVSAPPVSTIERDTLVRVTRRSASGQWLQVRSMTGRPDGFLPAGAVKPLRSSPLLSSLPVFPEAPHPGEEPVVDRDSSTVGRSEPTFYEGHTSERPGDSGAPRTSHFVAAHPVSPIRAQGFPLSVPGLAIIAAAGLIYMVRRFSGAPQKMHSAGSTRSTGVDADDSWYPTGGDSPSAPSEPNSTEESRTSWSEQREGFLGGSYVQHRDEAGRSTGYSEQREAFLGGSYVQHHDADGRDTGYSEEREAFLGGSYTQHYDADGRAAGYSEEREGFLGDRYTQHYDSDGHEAGYSKTETDWLGNEYVQHYDQDGSKRR